MSAIENKKIALNWIQAFNEHDIEKLLNLYDDYAEHYSPKLKVKMPETFGYIKKKEALKSWWQEAFNKLPSLKYDLKKLTVDDEQVFMEYIRQVDGEEDLKVGEVLEIKNGYIIYSRVYHG